MDGVSVVIPCLNEEKYIKDCVEGIVANGFNLSQLEILIIDGGSSDQTLEIVKKLQKDNSFIKVVFNKKKKTPFALNLGVQSASFNYILIAGAHAHYPFGYISRLYNLIQKDGVDVVGGALETKTKTINDKTKAICYVLSHPLGVGNSIFRIGADKLLEVDTVPFGLYSKAIFDKVGFYNEKLIRNHDMELSSRIKAANYQIWMDPHYTCTYFARETFKGLAKNNYGNGYWNLKTLAITRKFNSLSLRHYIPMLFILSIVLPILAGAIMSYLPAVFLGIGIALMHASTLFWVALRSKQDSKIMVWITFLVLHYSYGVGSIVGLLSWLGIKKAAH